MFNHWQIALFLVSSHPAWGGQRDRRRLHHPDVLRGGFGTMPAFAADYLRVDERRFDLRTDADSLGLPAPSGRC